MASRTISPGVRAPSIMYPPDTIRPGASAPDDVIGSGRVLVAIPARNMEVAIGSMVLRARKHADHVIVIDYGSTDNTAEVAILAGATVIAGRMNEENGKGIRDAFTFARRAGADVLVLIDGDALDRMEEIPRHIRPILEDKADFVNGMRPAEKKGAGDRRPDYLRRCRDALALAANVVRRRKAVTAQNGFRAFSRKMFDCFTFSQARIVSDAEAPEIAGRKAKGTQAPFYGRSGPGGPASGPFSGDAAGIDGPTGGSTRERPARLFCALGAGMILLGAGCVLLLMNHFVATHDFGIEYGIGSIIFTFPGLVLFNYGVMLRSCPAPAKVRD